ncbi:TonB-dependent receptor domain-containing protein [Denitromonas iodatirespirans]|uniref:TonB-dependent receptor n=1 Tax=Denitromonas iodatirespirans TaxID=2795389 RepID=A0A944HD67_DENI1|nr:TonB-dependent receptor [Denitromonas iodatirespirans]MBT0961781.1 TonB-dependent receptor [Denitromonas iodatirespirans]
MNIRLSALALTVGAVSVTIDAVAKDAAMDAVVVTATRQEGKVDELLADMTVVTRDEIEKHGQATLSQVLAATAGVFVTDGGLPGKTVATFIRGTNTGHALLLVDGVPVTSATLGQAPFEMLSAAEIERIEILRGPASSLYGSEAIGGVVQVFTRRGEGAPAPRVAVRYGSHDTRELQAGVSGGSESLSYALSASTLSTDGISATRGPASNPDRDGYESVSASGSLQWRLLDGHELGLQFLHVADENHTDGDLNFDNRTEGEIFNWSAYSRNRLSNWWTSTVRIGGTRFDSLTFRPSARDRFITDSGLVSWQNDLRTTWGNWLFGLEKQLQQVDTSGALVVDSRSIRSAFAGWSGAAGANSAQVNVRHDDIEGIGDKTTWSLAYGYQFTDTFRAFASMGTAFKAPSFNDLYFPVTCFPIWGCFGGNPDLKPESARNRELGMAWESGAHSVKVVYFDNRISDLIDWGNTPENIGKARISGLTATYLGTMGSWRWNAALDLLDPRDEETDNVLRRRPRERLLTGVEYTTGPWTLGGQWTLVGERYEDADNTRRMGGYGLLDLFARYRIDPSWTVESQIKNAGDKDYALQLGAQGTRFATEGRTVFVVLRYAPR